MPSLRCCLAIAVLFAAALPALAQTSDSDVLEFTARASQLDNRVKAYPEINFFIEKDGKPADVQHAFVNPNVESRGQLVLWQMGRNPLLFERLAGYGYHVIRVHYANGWFPVYGSAAPKGDDQFLGNIRLEAVTGEDFSPVVAIAKPDSLVERARRFLRHLDKQHPQGNWKQFLTKDGSDIQWDKVVLSGSSHGATVSARFAKHQKVARVVMLCGPRDQHDAWQALPSATPANRYFGFSHVLDGGWTGNHYCRSWEMLGLAEFGPIVDVDTTPAPFQNSRRLITQADVDGNANRAHGAVQPGRSAIRDKNGDFAHEAVWRYLYTHPVDEVGQPTELDPHCKVPSR